MDKILVTLLLVIVAVSGIIGLSIWTAGHKDTLQNQAVAEIEAVLEEQAPASGE